MSTGMLAGLAAGAKHFVDAVTTKLNGGGYPSGDADRGQVSIQEAIFTEAPQMDGSDKAHVNVVVDLQRAPYGAAYEFGSGIHSTAGKVGKYRIPKEGSTSVLVFPWNPPENPEGREIWSFTKVMHPGVEGKPYLRPTITAEADKIAELIGKEFQHELIMQILGDSPREEKIVVTL